ncbi:MAG: bifunctional glutamate N-acetyltransferase/amino-acid acetyltransferase ArgJ [Clostridia bacterium]
MKIIDGGVTAPKGFKANGVLAGIKKSRTTPDVALIVSDVMCSASGVYTQNLVKGAPIIVTQKNLENGKAQAVICNSGNANTCNFDGVEKAELMCKIGSSVTGIAPTDFIVASTGVIGQVIDLTPVEKVAQKLADGLSENGSTLAAQAIMTTDTKEKEYAVQAEIDGKTVTIGGIAKGSGMIHPNMATMLSFITSDCAISPEMIKKATKQAADKSFNMISVDGDTSTNDTLTLMANGLAKNEEITEENDSYFIFLEALTKVCMELSKMMAADGEGATKLVICKTINAKDFETGKLVSKSVICSSLFKSAMFGADANWGRVLCAIGYSTADVDVNKIDVSFVNEKGSLTVCENGAGIPFSEETAKEILSEAEVTVLVDLKQGTETVEAFGCDLTYDYVKINGDYRT